MNKDGRPDPDALLEKVQRDEAQAARGKLKIFFGACPGVGKTYAMLSAARVLHEQAREVVVGLVETHGRSETARLLEGLEYLPPKRVNYQGRELAEFDLDAALARKPALILVDELAHSNVAGSRHPKRWQDVEELLAAGIDVYTTVNVQHLESLNDIIGGITGVMVRETLPDRVFEQADEVTLVDLPADELLQRMKEGKVYLPQQAERAIRNFFRKGNLIALRELALRRTADRADAQMREYRADQSISQVWQAKERLMVCVGPGDDSSRLVRSAARLAASLHADWLAVYVETPKLLRLSEARRDKVFRTLRLAQELGAETTSLPGSELVPTLLAYAQERNVSKLVVGKSSRSMFARLLRPSPADQLASQVDMDVYIVGHDPGRCGAGQCVRSGQRHHAVPAGGGADFHAFRTWPRHFGLLAQRGRVRFLFRRSAFVLHRGRYPVSVHLRVDAGGRPGHQQPHRQSALSGAHRPLPGTPRRVAVRGGKSLVFGLDRRADHQGWQRAAGRGLPVPGRHPVARQP